MPCWFYEKKDLRVTPSLKDGINPDIEARYRREGARFIIDTGTKMGLRYDTCATGVVYFHRFYMFHSFREFHRYVTAACCLFLAGKVEETPKKCKDIIKTTRSMLTEAQFAVFGEDPREEVMTMERILLQTIKFDLMVEHPYAYLLKLAKLVKGDKDKTQKLIQMAWTFVNDSLCTMLCLQWEPDIIAVALMYLASRLTKVEVTDWQGKVPGQKVKWYEGLVEDATLEILEDVCHQVLDLYSTTPQASREDSPPPPPPPPPPKPAVNVSPVSTKTPTKRSRSPSPVKSTTAKITRHPSPLIQRSVTPTFDERPPATIKPVGASSSSTSLPPTTSYSESNPYMSSQMYSSSFMSGEGSNAIQTLIGGQPVPSAAPTTTTYSAAPPKQYTVSAAVQQPVAAVRSVSSTYATAAYPAQPPPQVSSYTHQYPAGNAAAAPVSNYTQQPQQYTQQQPPSAQPPPHGNYTQYSYPPPPPQQQQSAPAQSYNTYQAPQQQQQQQQGAGVQAQQPPSSQQYTSPYGQQPAHTPVYPPQQQPPPPQQGYNHYGGGGGGGGSGGGGGGGGSGGMSRPPPQQHHHHHPHQNRSNPSVRLSNRLPPRR